MYPVSSRFHTLAIQDAPTTRARIYFIDDTVDCTDDNDVQTNGTLLVGAVGDTDSNGRISESGITFNEFFNPEKNIMIGDCVSSQISMTLLNYDGALDGYTFGRCKVYLDVYDADNSAWLPCPMGVYIIEQPTKTRQDLISIHGFDQMQKLHKIADNWWNSINWASGVSFIQMINGLAAEVGVSVSATSAGALANSAAAFTFAATDCNNVTFRQILGLIGEATATTARFDRDGALDMRWFADAKIGGNTVSIDTDVVGNQCLSIDVAEYVVKKYIRVKYKIGSFSAETGYAPGDNTYYIIDNPFLNPQIGESVGLPQSDGLHNIYTSVTALGAYSPIQGKFIMDWSIESGDAINIVRNGNTYKMPIFQQSMTWRGGYVVADVMNDGDAVRPEWSTRSNEDFPVYSAVTSRSERTIASPGWYRAIRMNNGLQDHENPEGASFAVVDINIIGQFFESHTIQFRANFFGASIQNSKFCNETSSTRSSSGSSPWIDKIRYTHDSDAGYIDIHVNGSIGTDIAVLYNTFSRADLQNSTIPGGLESVADTPAGETVLTTYNFAANIPDSGTGYTKQPDGTMIQWGVVSGISFSSQNMKSGVASLPQPFIDTNYTIIPGATNTGMNAYLFRVGASPNNTTTFYWVLGSGDSSNITATGRGFNWLAFGRWK